MGRPENLDEVLVYEKPEAEIIAEKTEKLLEQLASEKAGLFTVSELVWLHVFITRIGHPTRVEYEKKLFKQACDLEDAIATRKNKEEGKA